MSPFERLRADLAHLCPMLLPPEARATSLEINSWLVTVRVYLHGPGGMDRWEALDTQLTPLVERRLPAGQRWDVTVQAVRRDRPAPLDVFGTVVWVEDGTEVASIDGHAVNTDESRPAT